MCIGSNRLCEGSACMLIGIDGAVIKKKGKQTKITTQNRHYN